MSTTGVSARGRGRPSVTSLDEIRAAALRVLDREGVSGLTVRAVARELGVDSPRIYTHIRDAEQLVTLAFEAAEAELDHDLLNFDTVEDWREGLRLYARALIQEFSAHPRLLDLSTSRRFFPTNGRGPALLEIIATDAARAGVAIEVLADGFAEITGTVVGQMQFLTGRSSERVTDQYLHDIQEIRRTYPAAARLLSHIGTTKRQPAQQILDLVEAVIARIDTAKRRRR